MHIPTIRFVRHGHLVELHDVPPSRTLLELLREDLAHTGTKEGCGEGDCGACTVVLGEVGDAGLRYRAINSCIRMAHSIDGLALWTVEDLAASDGSLHPAQQAMVQCHGSQCGFCTPGFVMSLFGMYQNHTCRGRPVSRALAQEELSGNLCRCTGYRPIFDAAREMGNLPAVLLDEEQLLKQLLSIRAAPAQVPTGASVARLAHDQPSPAPTGYLAPQSLAALLKARADNPQAQVVAGCTDVGLWVTKMFMEFASVLDVTRVAELRRIEVYPHHLAIGAAVPLADAFEALVRSRPQLRVFATRFAGLPVRNSGTLGGNVANGSPIGDCMPLLIALGANVVLLSQRGHREMPLEALYIGYRKNVIAADEVLAWIKVPLPVADEFSRVYKISKRFDDDISAICLALSLRIEDEHVVSASIGVGGVAATPVRARQTEAVLTGQRWRPALVHDAMKTLRDEFQPISDMRASAAYRSEVLGNLLQRFWMEQQGVQAINLESFTLHGEDA